MASIGVAADSASEVRVAGWDGKGRSGRKARGGVPWATRSVSGGSGRNPVGVHIDMGPVTQGRPADGPALGSEAGIPLGFVRTRQPRPATHNPNACAPKPRVGAPVPTLGTLRQHIKNPPDRVPARMPGTSRGRSGRNPVMVQNRVDRLTQRRTRGHHYRALTDTINLPDATPPQTRNSPGWEPVRLRPPSGVTR